MYSINSKFKMFTTNMNSIFFILIALLPFCVEGCKTSMEKKPGKGFLLVGGETNSGNGLDTQVIDIKKIIPPRLSFGDIPSKRRNSVGGLLGSTPILCGGCYLNFTCGDSSCITFKNSKWTKTHEMTTKRGRAASVQLNSTTLWILGGDNKDDGILDSSEFLSVDSSVGSQGPTLPIKMKSFCAVKYSERHVYIIGGLTETAEWSNNVFISNPMEGFTYIQGAALKTKRSLHTCGLMTKGQQSKIVVAGGYDGNNHLSSVEIFDPTINNWISGPSLPYRLYNSAMATSPDGGGVILFGGYNKDKFYPEDTILELRFDSNEWIPLPQKLNPSREGHVVVPISL